MFKKPADIQNKFMKMGGYLTKKETETTYVQFLEKTIIEGNSNNIDVKPIVSEELTGFDLVGKKAVIIANNYGHEFEIGQEVYIKEYNSDVEEYLAIGETWEWYLLRSEFKLIP